MAHSCDSKKCTLHTANWIYLRATFAWRIQWLFSAEERDRLTLLADSAMLPDDTGLSVLDDETPEIIEQAWLVSRYYTKQPEG